MVQFSPTDLSKNAHDHLNTLQADVDKQATRELQYTHAADLWQKRKNKTADKPVWKEIEDNLVNAHPRKGLCQFCEFDRQSPTEHFFSKKHFPNKAFRWENYLRICTKCNSEYKGDKFAVFNPAGSSIVFDLPITKGTYPIPPTEDAVLINPRVENPQHFLLIDFTTGIVLANIGINERDKIRAKYTIDLLHLSTDDVLIRYRRKAYFNYTQKLKEYADIKLAANFGHLLALLPDYKHLIINQIGDFEQEKTRLLNLWEEDIKDDPFPSVWLEIIQQRPFFLPINQVFTNNPEMLLWK
jgi:uncharacterized protein (TIGR02646 family)